MTLILTVFYIWWKADTRYTSTYWDAELRSSPTLEIPVSVDVETGIIPYLSGGINFASLAYPSRSLGSRNVAQTFPFLLLFLFHKTGYAPL